MKKNIFMIIIILVCLSLCACKRAEQGEGIIINNYGVVSANNLHYSLEKYEGDLDSSVVAEGYFDGYYLNRECLIAKIYLNEQWFFLLVDTNKDSVDKIFYSSKEVISYLKENNWSAKYERVNEELNDNVSISQMTNLYFNKEDIETKKIKINDNYFIGYIGTEQPLLFNTNSSKKGECLIASPWYVRSYYVHKDILFIKARTDFNEQNIFYTFDLNKNKLIKDLYFDANDFTSYLKSEYKIDDVQWKKVSDYEDIL